MVGAGQAGLAAGYHLSRRGSDVLILDAADSVGDSWRARWDSLRLFTPAGFNSMPGMPFPGPASAHRTKDAMADHLARYAEHFALPVLLGVRVRRAWRDGETFVVDTNQGRWRAGALIVATGAHQTPAIPDFAAELDTGVTQSHVGDYRRPSQLPAGPVLVVGAGNSGAEVALDLATEPNAAREVHLAGREVGHIPQLGPWTFQILQRAGRAGATLAQRGLRGRGDPLGRIRPGQLHAAGVQRHPRVVGVRDGLPLLDDGRSIEVASVIWCTGFRADYSWLDLDAAVDTHGRLRHRGGVLQDQPRLYAVGLPYQRSIASHLVGGVGADARYVVNHLLTRHARRLGTSVR
ncbi:flavin-containing monooxygenase [Ornithinicoccus halotolerans]|uniref:flavin-containing monooxygenase n=1 Tax=Ornithinicoccus halotolerans TaxID=1748220 RepID=UPI001E3946D2|nr:NAD(P)-binding domain-containing protein [Ornithinicoccus halotolerans]